jgi:GDP-4-dehydro-6-deoxy-D-mannose reductase
MRDFLHVADVVEAYVALLERGAPGEVYNVCSGEGSTVRELAATVLQRLGVSADIATDPARARPVDVPVLVGSNQKLRRVTGWASRRTRSDIIDDLIHAATR